MEGTVMVRFLAHQGDYGGAVFGILVAAWLE
jgi:hypothetical protein